MESHENKWRSLVGEIQSLHPDAQRIANDEVLISRYLAGECTDQERELVEQAARVDSQLSECLELARQVLPVCESGEPPDRISEDGIEIGDWKDSIEISASEAPLSDSTDSQPVSTLPPRAYFWTTLPNWISAASILISLGVLWFLVARVSPLLNEIRGQQMAAGNREKQIAVTAFKPSSETDPKDEIGQKPVEVNAGKSQDSHGDDKPPKQVANDSPLLEKSIVAKQEGETPYENVGADKSIDRVAAELQKQAELLAQFGYPRQSDSEKALHDEEITANGNESADRLSEELRVQQRLLAEGDYLIRSHREKTQSSSNRASVAKPSIEHRRGSYQPPSPVITTRPVPDQSSDQSRDPSSDNK